MNVFILILFLASLILTQSNIDKYFFTYLLDPKLRKQNTTERNTSKLLCNNNRDYYEEGLYEDEGEDIEYAEEEDENWENERNEYAEEDDEEDGEEYDMEEEEYNFAEEDPNYIYIKAHDHYGEGGYNMLEVRNTCGCEGK